MFQVRFHGRGGQGVVTVNRERVRLSQPHPFLFFYCLPQAGPTRRPVKIGRAHV